MKQRRQTTHICAVSPDCDLNSSSAKPISLWRPSENVSAVGGLVGPRYATEIHFLTLRQLLWLHGVGFLSTETPDPSDGDRSDSGQTGGVNPLENPHNSTGFYLYILPR